MNNKDLPIGFVMALAQNENALKSFEGMSDEQKQALVNKSRKINSKKEMHCFVESLSQGGIEV